MRNPWTVALASFLVAAACTPCGAQPPGHYGGGSYTGETYAPPDGGDYADYGDGPVSYNGGDSAVGGPVGPGYGGYDQLHPYDGPEPWLHGYWQEMPSYGGYVHFRPYNYKHVLSQSQVAAGWGMSPTTPYSQEIFRRYPPPSNTQARVEYPPLANTQARVEYPPPANTQVRVERRPIPMRGRPSHGVRPSYDEQVYRAEVARLRAKRDFDRVHGAAQQVAPAATVANIPASLDVPAKTVAPAGHVEPSKLTLEDLQEKIIKQQRELDELQNAIRRESKPLPKSAGTR